MGNLPVRSVYILFVVETTAQTKQFVRVGGVASEPHLYGSILTGIPGSTFILTLGMPFIDWRFVRSWSKWPLFVCSLFGNYFFTSFFVKPGNDARKPLSIAVSRVDLTGQLSEAWWNWARSFFAVSVRMMALHADNSDFGGLWPFTWTNHMLFGPFGCLMMMMLLFLLQITRWRRENWRCTRGCIVDRWKGVRWYLFVGINVGDGLWEERLECRGRGCVSISLHHH